MSDFDRYGTEPSANAPAGRAGGFDSYGAEEAPAPPTMSQAEAALHGYRTGASANFSDEIYGPIEGVRTARLDGRLPRAGGRRAHAVRAGISRPSAKLSDLREPGKHPKSDFEKTYEEATAQRRAEQATAEKEYPATFTGAQIGGSLMMPGANFGASSAADGTRAAQCWLRIWLRRCRWRGRGYQ